MIALTTTMPQWLLIPLVALLLPLILILKSKQVKRTNLPPGPPKLPIIGNLHQLGELPFRSLWKLSKEYGPIMQLQLGRMPTLVVSSAEFASEILKTHDLVSCSRPDLKGTRRLSYNFLDIAFGPYTEYWREMRKLTVQELFSVKRVQSFRFIREEQVFEMMSLISKSSSSATPINLSEIFYNFTDELICRIAFGKSYKGRDFDDGRFKDAIKEAFAMLGTFAAADFFPYVGWILDSLTGLNRRREKCFHEFDHFYQSVIDEHLKNKRDASEQEDIIDVLLKVRKDKKGGGPLSHDHIKGMLKDIFLGAVDTGAVVLEWTMTELAKNPEVMKKLQHEIRSIVGKKGKVVEADINQLKFLKMVVKEILRLHAPTPLLIPRETMQHFTINGYDIYPKTRVLVNVWAIGRDPKYWDKSEEFFPERFMDSSIDFKGTHFMFLPFGAGRRICPGMHMGIATVELALANLMYSFDWGLPDGMKKEDIDVDEISGLIAQKKSPIYLVPTEQNINSFSI